MMFDFGVERAGWIEFEFPDVSDLQAQTLRASISEYNEPWDGKTRQLTMYADGVYRLETNPDLYEGVRFVWLYVDKHHDKNGFDAFHMTALRVVSRVKPVNYTSHFMSNDPILTSSWYTGAYGSRLNMEDDSFNSILMDRGDRVSIQGDGNPTMLAALTAFSGPETFRLMRAMLKKTNSGYVNGHKVIDQGIMAYPILWGMSVNNYYWSSGDTKTFVQLAPDVGSIIDRAAATFLTPDLNIAWMGWDDRLGNGFCGSCNQEAQLTFATLLIRACDDFAQSLTHAGYTNNASHFTATKYNLTLQLRQKYHIEDLGLHAAGNFINARVATLNESRVLFSRLFNDAKSICSWSNFNQFWILQALNNMGRRDHAASVVSLCWGPMTSAWNASSRWGQGCFWELSSPEWSRFLREGNKAPTRPSYCHPWADGVTHFLSNDFAGIIPLSPSFKNFVVMPHLSPSYFNVSASHGPVSIQAIRIANGDMLQIRIGVTSKLNAQGESFVGLRKIEEGSYCTLEMSNITVNGDQVAPSAYDLKKLQRVHPLLGELFTYVKLTSQSATVQALYKCLSGDTARTVYSRCIGLQSCPPFSPAQYSTRWIREDHVGGSWIGKFGADGYVLFGINNGTDIQKLPTYITSVNKKGTRGVKKESKFVGQDERNNSFLEVPGASPSTRALGFVTSGADGSQGTVLDINVTRLGNPMKFNLTLYIVANVKPVGSSTWSATRQAIRTLDFATMNVIAKEPLLEKMDGGVYYTLVGLNKSLRLRVMPIDSDAGFSAVFFSSNMHS